MPGGRDTRSRAASDRRREDLPITVDLPPTPWHTEFDGRRVAASAPVDDTSLSLLREVEGWRPGVPRTERDATTTGIGPTAHGEPAGVQTAIRDVDVATTTSRGRPAGFGWRTDTFTVVLHRSRPDRLRAGDPWFERGRSAIFSYRMVDPAIVRGAWWADQPLLGRRIVQEGRFGPLRLRMATEVVAVVDGEVEVDGRTATVAGFEYRTLADHVEDGWQSWQLWRWHDTGVLEHHGHTTSRRSTAPNAVFRLGMRVFGRGMQLLAGRRSTARLTGFVLAGDESGRHADAVPSGEGVDPTPATRVRALASMHGARLLDADGGAA